MSSEENRNESLNESWTDVGESRLIGGVPRLSPVPAKAVNSAMEKLLLEAQRESSSSTSHADSPASSHASSRSSNADRGAGTVTPTHVDQELLPELKGTDWVWDWSSRPETIPPRPGIIDWFSGTMSRLVHPMVVPQRCRFSIRNTRVMHSLLYTMENLPMLLLTHACSFILGATTMFVCMRKYGGSWSSSATATIAAASVI